MVLGRFVCLVNSTYCLRYHTEKPISLHCKPPHRAGQSDLGAVSELLHPHQRTNPAEVSVSVVGARIVYPIARAKSC